jgi:hypothetical protein
MKTIALLSLMVLTFSSILIGQNKGTFNRIGDQKSDTIIMTPFRHDPAFENPRYKFNRNDDGIFSPEIDLFRKNFKEESPWTRDTSRNLSEEKFPGSGRFYTRRPYIDYPYEKSFIKKPDASVKYFLIIKDPISGRRTN